MSAERDDRDEQHGLEGQQGPNRARAPQLRDAARASTAPPTGRVAAPVKAMTPFLPTSIPGVVSP